MRRSERVRIATARKSCAGFQQSLVGQYSTPNQTKMPNESSAEHGHSTPRRKSRDHQHQSHRHNVHLQVKPALLSISNTAMDFDDPDLKELIPPLEKPRKGLYWYVGFMDKMDIWLLLQFQKLFHGIFSAKMKNLLCFLLLVCCIGILIVHQNMALSHKEKFITYSTKNAKQKMEPKSNLYYNEKYSAHYIPQTKRTDKNQLSVPLNSHKDASLLSCMKGHDENDQIQSQLKEWGKHAIMLKKELDDIHAALQQLDRSNRMASLIDEEKTKMLIEETLSRYDADKLGIPDYALESSGGGIISTPDTEEYDVNAWFAIWDFPIWKHQTHSPRNIIQPSVQPGQCWAFAGTKGTVVIQLARSIYVSLVTMEHIPVQLSLDHQLASAPKLFGVYGLRTEYDDNPVFLGQFTYEVTGTPIQSFEISNQKDTGPFNHVKLQILSNHGNQNFTCVYRFRVHGAINPLQRKEIT